MLTLKQVVTRAAVKTEFLLDISSFLCNFQLSILPALLHLHAEDNEQE